MEDRDTAKLAVGKEDGSEFERGHQLGIEHAIVFIRQAAERLRATARHEDDRHLANILATLADELADVRWAGR